RARSTMMPIVRIDQKRMGHMPHPPSLKCSYAPCICQLLQSIRGPRLHARMVHMVSVRREGASPIVRRPGIIATETGLRQATFGAPERSHEGKPFHLFVPPRMEMNRPPGMAPPPGWVDGRPARLGGQVDRPGLRVGRRTR